MKPTCSNIVNLAMAWLYILFMWVTVLRFCVNLENFKVDEDDEDAYKINQTKKFNLNYATIVDSFKINKEIGDVRYFSSEIIQISNLIAKRTAIIVKISVFTINKEIRKFRIKTIINMEGGENDNEIGDQI